MPRACVIKGGVATYLGRGVSVRHVGVHDISARRERFIQVQDCKLGASSTESRYLEECNWGENTRQVMKHLKIVVFLWMLDFRYWNRLRLHKSEFRSYTGFFRSIPSRILLKLV
jgi:hypothetical protein